MCHLVSFTLNKNAKSIIPTKNMKPEMDILTPNPKDLVVHNILLMLCSYFYNPIRRGKKPFNSSCLELSK